MVNALEDMLTRLKLTSIRNRLDSLLDEATRQNMTFIPDGVKPSPSGLGYKPPC